MLDTTHPVARGRDARSAKDYPGRRALAHVRRQRGDAARAQPEAVRRDRHRQHVRRHPVRRGVDARRARSACCRRRRSTPNGKGLYEPIHGSAPDIAGQDKANPLATILSLAMMFRYTFERADVAGPDRARGARGAGARACAPATSRCRARRRSARARWATRWSRRWRPELNRIGSGTMIMRVGFVGWRGMVGSVLMQRMREERDFDLIEPAFFTTSNVGGNGPGDRRATRPPLKDATDIDGARGAATRSSPARAATTRTTMLPEAARGRAGTATGSTPRRRCA